MRPLRPLLALLCLALAACSKKPAAQTPRPAPSVGPLMELLPPGPSPVVAARPRELFEHAEVELLWTTLVEPDDERALVERTGVDPRKLEELVVFEVGKAGYVLLARGPFSAKEVVLRAADRLAMLDVEVDEPVLRREGLSGSARHAYAVLDEHALLVAKNAAPTLVAAILARRTDRSLPRVFGSLEAEALYRTHGRAPCFLLAPRPLGLEFDSGAALLLAEERALAATAHPRAGAFRVEVDLRGDFPNGAEQNFRSLVLSVAQAPLGQLLGLPTAADAVDVTRDAVAVRIAFDWPAQRLAQALRALFLDDLRTLTRIEG